MDKFNATIEKWIERGYSLDRAIILTLMYFDFIENYTVTI